MLGISSSSKTVKSIFMKMIFQQLDNFNPNETTAVCTVVTNYSNLARKRPRENIFPVPVQY